VQFDDRGVGGGSQNGPKMDPLVLVVDDDNDYTCLRK
jgi:hypothetical protein